MSGAAKSPYRVPFDGSFRVKQAPTAPPKDAPSPKRRRERLERAVEELSELQAKLFAQNRWAVLAVFQAMDAAGKDGTIRAALTGVNPAGVEVYSFKAPSLLELDHDFLWRTTVCLPGRGRIGVFNRSYYEEVLVVRVHPEYLAAQALEQAGRKPGFWAARLEAIREHERHLAANGTVIVKFWLNVSKKEQARRFLSRVEEQEKNWKFQSADIRERAHWKEYMAAYQEAIRETSRPWAPWYAIPADEKDYMRMRVAEVLVDTLRRLKPAYPKLPPEQRADLEKLGRKLRKGTI